MKFRNIKIENLVKQYLGSPQKALDGVNLTIDKGDFFGLLGPNGSGKTTLISILCGLLAKTSGTVSIGEPDSPIKKYQLKKQIGLVPQEIALYPSLTLEENLTYFGRLYGLSSGKLKQRVQECVQLTGLKKVAKQMIKSYSGGMQRRANIAVGVIQEPSILFLDEPTVNVDPQSRETIFSSLQALNENGTTIIYTTHYLEEAERLCKCIAIIDYGKIVSVDTPQALIAQHPSCHNLGDVFMNLTGRELRD